MELGATVPNLKKLSVFNNELTTMAFLTLSKTFKNLEFLTISKS